MTNQEKTYYYLWLIPLSLYIPILLATPVFISNSQITKPVFIESLYFIPMGIIPGYTLLSALHKAHSKKIAQIICLAYLISLPIGIMAAIYYGIKVNPILGPLIGGIIMSAITYIIAFINRYKPKHMNKTISIKKT